MIDGRAPDRFFVEKGLTAKRRIDDEIDLAALDVVHHVRPSFINFINRLHIDTRTSKHTRRSAGRNDLESDFNQVCADFRNKVLVVLIDADERHSAFRKYGAGADLGLDVGFAKRVVHTHDFAGRFHLGTENRVDSLEPCEREDRRLDEEVIHLQLGW